MLALRFCCELRIEHDNAVHFCRAASGCFRDLLHSLERDIAKLVLYLVKHFNAGSGLIFVPRNDLIDLTQRFSI